MRIIYFIISLVCSLSWIYFLNNNLNVKDNTLPPLGKFFSPFQGFWQNGKNAFQSNEEILTNSGVQGTIYLDDRLVPHIIAQNLKDAFFLQGYIHAKHRLWQMDFSTRATEGRISEIIGERAIEFDRVKRKKGFAESAKKSVAVWKKFPETFSLIESYCEGVNHYIQSLSYKNLPIEYKLMDFYPEPWTPYKSSLYHKGMSDILCGREHDIEMTNAKTYFGDDFERLFPEFDSLLSPVIPSGTAWNLPLDTTKKYFSTKPVDVGYIPVSREHKPSGLGSNNWAIGVSKSTSGNPILCGDPHLGLSLPSVWYEQQITTPEENVYGVGFAGLPGVVIGFNQHIAWTQTNAGWDVMDWYQIQWQDTSMKKYKYDDQWIDVQYSYDTIYIKNKKAHIESTVQTVWGPVIYNDPKHSKYGLAMHWVVNEPSSSCELDVFLELNKGKDLEDYKKAIQKFPYPAQNFAFASAEGDIAITAQGKMPIKKNQQGRFVQDGSISSNQWNGFIPPNKNPQSINPSRGFVASANQKSTDQSFPNYYNDGDFRNYRGTMINRILSSKEKWTIKELRDLQLNSYSLKAETVLPYFLAAIDTSRKEIIQSKEYQSLKSWNYYYDSNKVAPVFFDLWFDGFHHLVWDEITKDSTKKNVAVPSDQTTIALMKKNSQLNYFDLKSSNQIETAKDIIQIAFDSLLNFTLSHLEETKNWATFKDPSIAHIAKIPAFGKYHLVTSGAEDIINAQAKLWGPSWRMAVEMTKDGPIAYGVYPGGQSGHPGSPYYDQMIESWRTGQYYLLNYCKTENDMKNVAKFKMSFSK
ncbi:MAG: penicillin acylase family protein [Bacteroidota bacterium]|nr:penicillin acylase family protein [Bacteroidota bacterium]